MRSQIIGWSWLDGWAKLLETAVASDSVIEARQPVIEAAWRNPFLADHTELWRMGAEKMEAFGEAGRLWSSDMAAIQRDMILQGQEFGALIGKIPSPADAQRIAARTTRIRALH